MWHFPISASGETSMTLKRCQLATSKLEEVKWGLSRREFKLKNNNYLIVSVNFYKIHQKISCMSSREKINKQTNKICSQSLHSNNPLESVRTAKKHVLWSSFHSHCALLSYTSPLHSIILPLVLQTLILVLCSNPMRVNSDQ